MEKSVGGRGPCRRQGAKWGAVAWSRLACVARAGQARLWRVGCEMERKGDSRLVLHAGQVGLSSPGGEGVGGLAGAGGQDGTLDLEKEISAASGTSERAIWQAAGL